MTLWIEWWNQVSQLQPAFSRKRTFFWFALALAATCVRSDLAGVTSMVRVLGLRAACYDRLLDCFHSQAIDLEGLTRRWVSLVLATLKPFMFTLNGRVALVADGIKVAKTGRHMPAVKKLHQESDNNSKPEYIFGHSCQAVSIMVKAASSFFALPLVCRIHEGVVFSNRDHRTLLDKLILLVGSLQLALPYYLIADSYYAAAKIILPLLKTGQHLITSVRSNAVAYEPATPPATPQRGRRRIYGNKIKLSTLFRERKHLFTQAPSPIYGETNVTLSYLALDLYWRPVALLVRFVLVIHPDRGCKIFLSTDTSLSALQIITLYGLRFKIEVGFKQAIYTIGTYAYHFWMQSMTPRPRRSGNQHLHRKSDDYRRQVRRKISAYHAHIQLGVIAQGLLQILAVRCTQAVRQYFGSWFRTIRLCVPPSELIVATALRNTLPLFLAASPISHPLAKFIRDRLDLDRIEGLRLAA